MKRNFSLFYLPDLFCGSFYPPTTCYVEEKREENSTYIANPKRQSAKNGGKIMVMSSLLPFALRVNVISLSLLLLIITTLLLSCVGEGQSTSLQWIFFNKV